MLHDHYPHCDKTLATTVKPLLSKPFNWKYIRHYDSNQLNILIEYKLVTKIF